MPVLTSDTFADAMKTYYLGPLEELINQVSPMMNRLERNSEDVSGNFAYIPVITARNPGVGSRKDTTGTGPKLPAAGRQTYDAYTFTMAFHYARGSVSGPTMRRSRNNAGAFVKALDVEMQGLMKRIPSDLNRQAWSYGHGRGASLAANSVTAATTFEAASNSIFSLKIGDRVAFAAIANGASITPASGAIVTNIVRDTDGAGAASTTKHTVTIDTAIGASVTATQHAVYFGGGETLALEDISYGQEMYGIPALIDDGNVGADEIVAADADEIISASLLLGSVDRASIPAAQSIVLTNPAGAGTNRPLTISLFEQAYLQYQHIAGGDIGSLEIHTNPGLWAAFGLLHIGDRRYNDYQKEVKGGFTAIMYNEKPIFADRDAPRDIFWFLDMSNIMLLTQGGYDFIDEDGNTLNRILNRDAFEFALSRDCQMGIRNGRTHVKLDDVATVFNVEANI